MIRRVDVAIVGGGVNGLACAYNLARRGVTDIVVLEKGYLGAGATGRCGAGIRQQWGMEANIVLARESVKLFEQLSDELGFNTFFRQGGYLILISDEKEYELIKSTVPVQNRLAVPTRMMTPQDIVSFVPGINVDGVLGGAYNTNAPPLVLYGVLRRWSPGRFRDTLQGYFVPANALIWIGHGLTGLWTVSVVKLYVLALPLVLLAIVLGTRLNQRIPADRFERFLYVIIIGLGLWLLF